MRKLAPLTAVATVSLTVASLAATSPVAAITEAVDITVTLELGSETRTFHVDDVVPGVGVELDVDDETAPNETGYVGALAVDIDPDADTVTLIPRETGGFYDTIRVEIATTQVDELDVVTDDAIVEEDIDPTITVTDTLVTIAYTSGGPTISDDEADTSVFSYGTEPQAALTPASVRAGDTVTVSGTGCPNSPVLATISPEGGAPIVDEEEQTTGDAEGDWSFDIDTTGFANGDYTVAARCVLADLQGFDYDVLSFEVTAEPATPAPAAPSYTG